MQLSLQFQFPSCGMDPIADILELIFVLKPSLLKSFTYKKNNNFPLKIKKKPNQRTVWEAGSVSDCLMSLWSVMILESLELETRNYLLQQEPSVSPVIQTADKSWHLHSGVGESLSTAFPSLPSPEPCCGIWERVKNDNSTSFTVGIWKWLHEEGNSETRMRLLWQESQQSWSNFPALVLV